MNYWQYSTDDELLTHYHDALERRHRLWSLLIGGHKVDADRVVLNNKCVRDIEAEMTARVARLAAAREAARAAQEGPDGRDPSRDSDAGD